MQFQPEVMLLRPAYFQCFHDGRALLKVLRYSLCSEGGLYGSMTNQAFWPSCWDKIFVGCDCPGPIPSKFLQHGPTIVETPKIASILLAGKNSRAHFSAPRPSVNPPVARSTARNPFDKKSPNLPKSFRRVFCWRKCCGSVWENSWMQICYLTVRATWLC